jgi:DNA-binding NarL/FixJ family response regulator
MWQCSIVNMQCPVAIQQCYIAGFLLASEKMILEKNSYCFVVEKKRYKLSPREIEIIQLIKKGKATKEIADEIFLSVFTVETHRKNIFKKLNINSVGQLISFAVENNI